MVPRLTGLRFDEAAELLNSQSLNMGVVLACAGCINSVDTAGAFVTNQSPARGSEVNLGSFIDVFLSTDSSATMNIGAAADTMSYEVP
jgi:beta-lactam-binding protein with PASTA domain